MLITASQLLDIYPLGLVIIIVIGTVIIGFKSYSLAHAIIDITGLVILSLIWPIAIFLGILLLLGRVIEKVYWKIRI